MFKEKKAFFTLIILMIFSIMPLTINAQLDDPTRPPGYRLALPGGVKVAKKDDFSLSSVRISSTRRTAVVSDQSVEVGDFINGAKVLAIYPSYVRLRKNGKTFTVRLISQVIKKIKTR